MESEKRKRGDKEKNEERKKKKPVSEIRKERVEEETTEEQVEEFYAILRRMQAAVKYFGVGWRKAVETEAAATAPMAVDKDNDNNDDKYESSESDKLEIMKKKEDDQSNGHVLDLNTAPEAEGDSHPAN